MSPERFALILAGFALVPIVQQVQAAPSPASGEIDLYRQRQAKAVPQEVLAWLEAGNKRFAEGDANHGGYPTDARGRLRVAAAGQRPLAVVLSCIDSRTTPEMAFDTSIGDLFTVRVGANIVNDDILGSLEIAAESGAKVLVVLGHTDCGGVKAACNNVALGHLTQLLEKVKPAITAIKKEVDIDLGDVAKPACDSRGFIAEASHENARRSAGQILRQSSILREMVAKGELILVPALFDVNTGRVSFDATMEAKP